LKDLIKIKGNLRNLLILLYLWAASAFNYNLITFQMKYIEGDIYTNSIVSSVSEIVAYLISGALYEKLGSRVSFVSAFLIAALGSILLVNLQDTHKALIPVMVLGSKFGISASFNAAYLSNSLFPTLYQSITMGIFNFFARLSAFMGPQVAEFNAPTPMLTYCAISLIAAVLSFFLHTEDTRRSIREILKD
jgi:MFS family permease